MLGPVFSSGFCLKSTKTTTTPAASSAAIVSAARADGPCPSIPKIATSAPSAIAFSRLKLSSVVSPSRGTSARAGKRSA